MFMRYISHEIRTPMNTVKMGLEMLSEELGLYSLPPELLASAEDSRKSCDTAIEVLNELLTLDKLETNTLLLEFSELNAMTFIKQTVQPFSVQVRICPADPMSPANDWFHLIWFRLVGRKLNFQYFYRAIQNCLMQRKFLPMSTSWHRWSVTWCPMD
jgi:signal transduction histidine kinase